MDALKEIYTLLLKGRAKPLAELIEKTLSSDISPEEILSDALLPAMSEIGEKFRKNEMFVPEVMRSAQAFNQALAILKPRMVDGSAPAKGTCVIGTVFGDRHDIGKNLVSIMMQGAGINVIDLGSEVSPEQFVNAAVEADADIIAMSALLTTTMKYQAETIKLLEEKGIREKFKVMVGGAPITDEFAAEIGADAYTPDAGSAAKAALEFIGA